MQNICCILRSLALCLAAPLGEKKKSLNGSILGVKKAINFSAKPTPSSPYPPTLVRATPCQSKSRCCFGNFSTKCTLRVRLGGRHGGSATSCFCADPCTHSVQDPNRLTCFGNFWTPPPPLHQPQGQGGGGGAGEDGERRGCTGVLHSAPRPATSPIPDTQTMPSTRAQKKGAARGLGGCHHHRRCRPPLSLPAPEGQAHSQRTSRWRVQRPGHGPWTGQRGGDLSLSCGSFRRDVYARGKSQGGGTAALPRPASKLTLVCTACRTLIGYFVSATFGTMGFGGSFFWWSMKIKFFL